jgi:hypothetical protein
MKKLLLSIALVSFCLTANAQDSKFYAGVGVGYATAGGEALEGVNGGLSLNFLNLGLRFNETFGITANLSSTGHTIEDVDDVAVGIGTFSVGPMISFSISDNVSWDLKPQYAISMKAVYADDSGTIDDVEFSGNAFIFANSLVFGDGGSGFAFSIDLDYLSGKFTEFEVLGNSVDIDDENKMNNFKIGVGLRYNF